MGLIRKRGYWPGLWKDVGSYVDKWRICGMAKAAPLKVIQGYLTSEIPGEILAIDFTSLEKCKGGIEHVLVMTNVASKFTLAVGTKDQWSRDKRRGSSELVGGVCGRAGEASV